MKTVSIDAVSSDGLTERGKRYEMKNRFTIQAVLFLSGLIGMGIGSAILFTPVEFYGSSGIEIGGKISLLNEIRASGGALLACGALIIMGVFVAKLRFTSALLSALLYLSYGISRLWAMSVDGMPEAIYVIVAVMEIVIGLICAYIMVLTFERSREVKSTAFP